MIIIVLFLFISTSANDGIPPVIKDQPQSVVARRNDPATLNCGTTGASHITWFRDGDPVVTSSEDPRSHRLLLPSGSLFFLRVATGRRDTDAGSYWCVASNDYGMTRSSNATLVVATISYEFQRLPEALVKVKIDQKVVLPCRPPKGSPVPSVRWLKNGQEVGNSSRVFATLEGDLVIRQVELLDSASYICEAQNIGGSRESSPTQLVVMSPPKFKERLRNITTVSGVSVELKCLTSGSPPPKITWSKANGKLPHGRAKVEEKRLILEYVGAADSGAYKCEAQNEAGRITSVATLKVVDAPVLVEKPQTITALAGERIELSCLVEGNPKPLIMWRLPTQDRTALLVPSQNNGHATVSDDGQMLIVKKSVIQDSGIYYCWGSSSGGGVSAHVKVMVMSGYPPPVIGVGPQDLILPPGSVASLPCEVVSEASTPSISWLYRASEQSPTRFLSENSSDPSMSITINGALILKDIDQGDAGIYTCNVKSNTGIAEQEAVIKIDEHAENTRQVRLPAPPSKPQITVLNKTSVQLKWHPNSQVPIDSESWYTIEYWKHSWEEWRVAAAVVSEESNIITDLTSEDVYMFFIRAVTSQGVSFPSPWSDPVLTQSSGEALLSADQIHQARRRLSKPTVTLVAVNTTSPNSALLTWKFLIDQEVVEGVLIYTVAVDRRVNVATVLGSSSLSHLLSNLQPNTGYTVFVVPFWRNIEGSPSNSFTLFTPEDIPGSPPANVHIAVDGEDSAVITWSALTVKEARGKITGYQVTLTHNGSQIAEVVADTMLKTHNLVPGRLYTVRVAAQTAAGLGPFSPPVLMDLGSEVRQTSHEFSHRDSDNYSIIHVPPQPAWLAYLLVPIVLLLFAATLYYVRKLHQKTSPDPPHSPVLYQDPSIYPSHPSINMYSEQKLWRPNGYGNTTLSSIRLLPSDHQTNEYAEPRTRQVEEMAEPYATTSLLHPASPRSMRNAHVRHARGDSPGAQMNWTAFLPPPPSCPPPCDLDIVNPNGQSSAKDPPRIYTESSEYDNISMSGRYKKPFDATSEHNCSTYAQVPVNRCRNGSLTLQSSHFHSCDKSGRIHRPRRPSLPPYNNTH